MKIAVTVCDFGAAANVGGDVERRSAIIDLPDELVPTLLKAYVENRAKLLSVKHDVWQSASFSIVEESP